MKTIYGVCTAGMDSSVLYGLCCMGDDGDEQIAFLHLQGYEMPAESDKSRSRLRSVRGEMPAQKGDPQLLFPSGGAAAQRLGGLQLRGIRAIGRGVGKGNRVNSRRGYGNGLLGEGDAHGTFKSIFHRYASTSRHQSVG